MGVLDVIEHLLLSLVFCFLSHVGLPPPCQGSPIRARRKACSFITYPQGQEAKHGKHNRARAPRRVCAFKRLASPRALAGQRTPQSRASPSTSTPLSQRLLGARTHPTTDCAVSPSLAYP